jgi:DNA-binding HxlR family transcriptional regulator/peroxiredoxin
MAPRPITATMVAATIPLRAQARGRDKFRKGTYQATASEARRRRVRTLRERDTRCAIAQAAAVVGDWWSLLVIREVARGRHRFDELAGELDVSRKVLAERLRHLVGHGILERAPYQRGPTRHEYRLTGAGWALAPVLVSLQDWSERWLLGDGVLSGTASPDGGEAARMRELAGTRVPALALPATLGEGLDVVADASVTVLFGYPATGTPSPLPADWARIPGAVGCTLEARLFRDAAARCAAEGVAIRGVSTQRPDEQRAFAEAEGIPFPLLSDVDLRFAAALRLPTFRAGQALRLKRIILLVDRSRVVRAATFPVPDIPAAVRDAVDAAAALARAAA